MSTATEPLTLADAMIGRLEDHGVRHVFGIPGIHNLPLYQGLAKSTIAHVSARHEQGAGYAADGYARASGRPGVCVVTSGPGLTNIITPVATAHADSVPLLVISPGMTDEVDGHDTGFLHELRDQHGLMGSVTRSVRVRTLAQALAAIDHAFASFAHERPRPIHIEVPLDRLASLAGSVPPDVAPATIGATAVDEDSIQRAADALATARAPAMILGGGAKDAARQALFVARAVGAPVVTSVNGKGVVPEDDPLSLGASIRLRCVQEFLGDRDVVLIVGSELAESDLWRPPPLESSGLVIRVDLDPAQLQKNLAAAIPIHGDAARTLERISELLPVRRHARETEDLSTIRQNVLDEVRRDGGQFQRLVAATGQALAPDAIVASDSTMACYYGLVHFLRQRQPRQLLYPTGYATLGYGLPAAIGAKLAQPSRQVVCVMGDGGILFTIQELATAVEQQLTLPIVVVTNGGYGEIRRAMGDLGMIPLAVDFNTPDFGRIAEGFGAAGARADSCEHLGELLAHALKRPGPTVIAVEQELRP